MQLHCVISSEKWATRLVMNATSVPIFIHLAALDFRLRNMYRECIAQGKSDPAPWASRISCNLSLIHI
eukprot:409674-Amphidinium_carterae.1